jgi:hypothetical protein
MSGIPSLESAESTASPAASSSACIEEWRDDFKLSSLAADALADGQE